MNEAEAREILAGWLDASNAEVLILLLEALVGPDVVVDAALSAMEKYEKDVWTGRDLNKVVYELGFLLLRVPAAAAEKARARLEALYEKVTKAGWQSKAVSYLDVVLHGVEGAERSGYRPDGKGKPLSSTWLAHVIDNPAWVAKAVRAGGAPDASLTPDPRLIFLGGDDVLAAECSWWKKYSKPGAQQAFVDRVGRIRDEALLPVLLEMTSASKAKKEATAWFVEHADFAREFLEKQSKGKSADAAKAVLKAMG